MPDGSPRGWSAHGWPGSASLRNLTCYDRCRPPGLAVAVPGRCPGAASSGTAGAWSGLEKHGWFCSDALSGGNTVALLKPGIWGDKDGRPRFLDLPLSILLPFIRHVTRNPTTPGTHGSWHGTRIHRDVVLDAPTKLGRRVRFRVIDAAR